MSNLTHDGISVKPLDPTNFPNRFTTGKYVKFPTTSTQYFPPHFNYVAAQSRKLDVHIC